MLEYIHHLHNYTRTLVICYRLPEQNVLKDPFDGWRRSSERFSRALTPLVIVNVVCQCLHFLIQAVI
jgi:hypothetical protein